MSKVYFACSIRGGRSDAQLYYELVQLLKKKTTVLTEIFADGSLTAAGMNKDEKEIWQTDISWIKESDAVIAEVTNPSLGVGYEIAKAEEWGKPVLALYREQEGKKLSAMILGSPLSEVIVYKDISDLENKVKDFISRLPA